MQELGIIGPLYRTLRTTNPIENLNGSVARALSNAAHRMRKLRGCSQMRSLLKALDARHAETEITTLRKAA